MAKRGKEYTIKLINKINNKEYYFSQNGLFHSGKSKSKGYSMYTEDDAEKAITFLKPVLGDGFEYKIIHESQIPFIKRQRARARLVKIKQKADSSKNKMPTLKELIGKYPVLTLEEAIMKKKEREMDTVIIQHKIGKNHVLIGFRINGAEKGTFIFKSPSLI